MQLSKSAARLDEKTANTLLEGVAAIERKYEGGMPDSLRELIYCSENLIRVRAGMPRTDSY